jgi:predicted RNA binding protein YcfA (HicA-like mRNA interferase family)
MIMQLRKAEGGTITVPVPDHRELKTGTLLGIIEQSMLPRALFEAPE